LKAIAAEAAHSSCEINSPLTRADFFLNGDNSVSYVTPTPTKALLELHEFIHRKIENENMICRDHYKPSRWKPHVSIAFPVASINATSISRTLEESDILGDCIFDKIEVVRSPPWTILSSNELQESNV
jgi:2'-5' RNA ligase